MIDLDERIFVIDKDEKKIHIMTKRQYLELYSFAYNALLTIIKKLSVKPKGDEEK